MEVLRVKPEGAARAGLVEVIPDTCINFKCCENVLVGTALVCELAGAVSPAYAATVNATSPVGILSTEFENLTRCEGGLTPEEPSACDSL